MVYGDFRHTTAGSKHRIPVIGTPELAEEIVEAQESFAHYDLANPSSKLFVERVDRRHRLRMRRFHDPLP